VARGAARPDGGWIAEGHAIAAALGIDRVTFLESSAASTPFTCGVITPVVVLPSEAADWPSERRRAVLLHELAHVKRLDCLTHLVTRVSGALYWFHPAIWLAAHRLRIERERACDDVVLEAGIQGSAYGQHLIEIAKTALSMPSPVPTSGVAMAYRGRLEERIVSILDPRVARRSALSARLVIAVFGMLALAAAAVHVKAQVPAQAPALAAPPPTIEVAVIKRNKTEEDRRKVEDPRITRYPGRAQTLRGGTISGHNMTVKELIRDAYGYRGRAASEVIGGPAWLDTEVYEVQAKFDREFRLSSSLGLPPEGELALRTLLADRFHLKAHVETQRRPVYEMVLQRADGRFGPNLKRSEGGCIPFSKREPINVGLVLDEPKADEPKPLRPCMAAVGIFGITLENEPLESWARLLSVRPQLNRTVIDRTGLTGSYDFRLVNEAALQGSGPPLEAPIKPLLEQQLGLTLRDAQGPVEVLVIDSIDHPTEN
jgi:uncharacterized protein (TIGR03435 family)